MKRIFSSTSWGMVIGTTVVGTLICIAATFAVDYPNFADYSPGQIHRAIVVDVLLPAGLALPVFFFLMTRIRELNIARRELEIIASTDSLTTTLSRGAFTALVEAYLEKAAKQKEAVNGALLVVDADRFKRINDLMGHKEGDRALVSIAAKIKSSLRSADLVGRIGGEEFGVFLPDAPPAHALEIAERIRTRVGEIEFQPSGQDYPLSVSIGGVMFETAARYDELFISADKQLYAAKKSGRNQVQLISYQDFLARQASSDLASTALTLRRKALEEELPKSRAV